MLKPPFFPILEKVSFRLSREIVWRRIGLLLINGWFFVGIFRDSRVLVIDRDEKPIIINRGIIDAKEDR